MRTASNVVPVTTPFLALLPRTTLVQPVLPVKLLMQDLLPAVIATTFTLVAAGIIWMQIANIAINAAQGRLLLALANAWLATRALREHTPQEVEIHTARTALLIAIAIVEQAHALATADMQLLEAEQR